jgi:hypothetical protein
VQAVLDQLKAQPLPSMRQEIRLDNWRYLGYGPNDRQRERRKLAHWRSKKGMTVTDERLQIIDSAMRYALPAQSWRMDRSIWRSITSSWDGITFM